MNQFVKVVVQPNWLMNITSFKHWISIKNNQMSKQIDLVHFYYKFRNVLDKNLGTMLTIPSPSLYSNVKFLHSYKLNYG